MPIIDYRESIQLTNDPANLGIVGRVNSKTVRLMMFTTPRNGVWAADRALKAEAYPLAHLNLTVNRDQFRTEPGDLFRFNYSKRNISNMVCRVQGVSEEDLADSEKIVVNALEDVDYISTQLIGIGSGGVSGEAVPEDLDLEDLVNVTVVEGNFVSIGEDVAVIPIASKELGIEVGYLVYMSIDGGSSYDKIAQITVWAVYGTLVASYPSDTYQIDDQIGFEIEFDCPGTELDKIQTVSREYLLTGKNMAILGDEIISFQTVTPVTATKLKLEGIYRGRFDTIRVNHGIGEKFYFIGTEYWNAIRHSNIIVGSTRKFKLVPYSLDYAGAVSDASEISLSISGRAKTPYMPINIMGNGAAFNPLYTGDIVLDWDVRFRGTGAGIGDADTVVDASPVWEGLFKVEVWVSSVLVRTVAAIDAQTWTYTSAMNTTDNGSLASVVVFKVSNYLESGGITYESDQNEITVKKE